MCERNQSHNKTQKNYLKESFDKKKVNDVLEKIHNLNQDDEDDEDNFNPPPKPESSGVSKTISNENMANLSNNMNQQMFRTLGREPHPNFEDKNLELNNYSNYGDQKTVDEYYKKILPGYKPPSNISSNQNYNMNNQVVDVKEEDILIKKLNYMITLLEDQQDERTNNVTEEVVLYSFLGIFIIFVIDSFVRVGKYTR